MLRIYNTLTHKTEEFIVAECEESGLGIWNRSYWDSLPGEGDEIWLPEESGKWPVIYQ